MPFKKKTTTEEPDLQPQPVTPTSSDEVAPAATALKTDVNPELVAAVVAATIQALGITPGAAQTGQLNALQEVKQVKKTVIVQMRAMTHARDRSGVIWRYEQKGRYRVSLEIAELWISNRLAVLDGMPLHLDDPFQGYAGIVAAKQADAPEAGSELDATPLFQERAVEMPQGANTPQGFLVRQANAQSIETGGGRVAFADDLRRQAEEVARIRGL